MKYICSIVKHGLHKPTICPDCNTYIERIDNHLNHVHQLRKCTKEINKEIKNAKKFTRQFEINLNTDEDLEEDKSQEEESDENENEEERNTKHTKKQKPVKKDKKYKEISQHQPEGESTISSPKSK